jgi:hypothetical protein
MLDTAVRADTPAMGIPVHEGFSILNTMHEFHRL